jgi:hypothetical protein
MRDVLLSLERVAGGTIEAERKEIVLFVPGHGYKLLAWTAAVKFVPGTIRGALP